MCRNAPPILGPVAHSLQNERKSVFPVRLSFLLPAGPALHCHPLLRNRFRFDLLLLLLLLGTVTVLGKRESLTAPVNKQTRGIPKAQ